MNNTAGTLDFPGGKYLETIESTYDEHQRISAIEALAAEKSEDAARLLISIYSTTMWRENKIAILRALGNLPFQRTLHFLMRICINHQDLPLARQACFALAKTNDPLAIGYLLHLTHDFRHLSFVKHCARYWRPDNLSIFLRSANGCETSTMNSCTPPCLSC